MTNEEIWTELSSVSERMHELERHKNWHERNLLVPRYRELYRLYDFKLAVGEKIQTYAWQKRLMDATITEKTEDNFFAIRNDLGWEVIVPGTLIKKTGNIEQLCLFN
ncbi:hypothetical protein ACPA0F_18515 [Solibacillus silvestris]